MGRKAGGKNSGIKKPEKDLSKGVINFSMIKKVTDFLECKGGATNVLISRGTGIIGAHTNFVLQVLLKSGVVSKNLIRNSGRQYIYEKVNTLELTDSKKISMSIDAEFANLKEIAKFIEMPEAEVEEKIEAMVKSRELISYISHKNKKTYYALSVPLAFIYAVKIPDKIISSTMYVEGSVEKVTINAPQKELSL